MRTWLAATLLAGLALGLGCSSGERKDEELPRNRSCSPGDYCACDTDCESTCQGAQCLFYCNGGPSCVFDCGSGSCQATASNSGDVVVNCAGGHCTLVTTGSGNRTLNCPGGGCGLFCSGSTTCAIAQCSKDCQVRCDGVADGGCQSSCGDGGGCSITNVP